MMLAGLLITLGLYLYIAPNLPSIESLKDVKFQVPLRIFTADGELIGEFGEKRRSPLLYEEMPEQLIQAVLSAEDDRFFEHPGIDALGLLRAVGKLITTGKKVQGGGTITMQVARNFFLSREKTFLRKFTEILLAFKIEHELDKKKILELYLNKIYFGKRAYGVGAAALTYYGKDIRELSLAEYAMIAGLPKAPSRYNPIVNPKRALLRRNYVLRRMNELGYIDEEAYKEAVLSEVTAEDHGHSIDLEAPYIAEMVRQELVDRYGNDVYTEGYQVYTTVESRLQKKANHALRTALLDYETRHGYRGPVHSYGEMERTDPVEWSQAFDEVAPDPVMKRGFVFEVNEKDALVYLEDDRVVNLCWDGIKWAAPYQDGNWTGPEPTKASDVVRVGHVVYLRPIGNQWEVGQVPKVQGAIVSLRSRDGAIQAVMGGYDFNASKFNRVIQAKRQPGSNFKPFVYSAALEKGYTAATLINDAPVVFDDPGLEDTWRPENYSGKFFGPTRFREALVKSRNLVSIRILRSIGISYALDYVKKFGFDPAELPRDLSLALGSATVTPLSIARGYATFSNGGFRVDPYIIQRIVGNNGELLFKANPAVVCGTCSESRQVEELVPDISAEENEEQVLLDTGFLALDSSLLEGIKLGEESVVNLAPRVLSSQNVYIMTSVMRDIINRGTGRRAKVLGRNDLAGKTGTTNDQQDAWFSGFNGEVVTTAWVGFDDPHPLGDSESGARAALPMWISFMREALRAKPETRFVQPPGIVTVKIDPNTGMLAGPATQDAIFEYFPEDKVPTSTSEVTMENSGGESEGGGGSISEQLF